MTTNDKFTGTSFVMVIEVEVIMSVDEDPEFSPLTEAQARDVMEDSLDKLDDIGGYTELGTKIRRY